MGQLIDRYGIHNKRVIALSAGSCFEEQYFVKLGDNQLTVVDILRRRRRDRSRPMP